MRPRNILTAIFMTCAGATGAWAQSAPKFDAGERAVLQRYAAACPAKYAADMAPQSLAACARVIRDEVFKAALAFREATNSAEKILGNPKLGYWREEAHLKCGAVLDGYDPEFKSKTPFTADRLSSFAFGISACAGALYFGEAQGGAIASEPGFSAIAATQEAACIKGAVTGDYALLGRCAAYKKTIAPN
ncbi:MAG: hypothetical protein H6865_07495 [Rhodospirillales bacterium]|nr:hypothetical protein [Alphaproteobacteria bacterium]MCB9987458.1 hypothetical protein [Rhodospirillales bacterium]USO07563.1 MAG: hypothetical protein H6866_09160 [Rhodospirillales bacterium]